MTKIPVLDSKGNKVKEINTNIFEGQIRRDIIQKIVETEKTKQPYAPYLWQGMETSASGNVKHNRHVWKSDRGKGMSRFPKKRMSDKGDRFVWTAAVIPGVRGGRRAHPPKILHAVKLTNKKEMALGWISGLALISSLDNIKSKYSRIQNSNIKITLPIVIDNKVLGSKTKEIFNSLKAILGPELWSISVQERDIRAGRGKMRNRKYKKNAGLLIVLGNKENKKINGLDTQKAKDLKLIDFASNGARLTLFTEEAIKDLEERITKLGWKK